MNVSHDTLAADMSMLKQCFYATLGIFLEMDTCKKKKKNPHESQNVLAIVERFLSSRAVSITSF